MQNLEFIKEFIEEATVHVETVENGLLLFGNGTDEPDTIHGIFRAVHSIKGTAGFFGLQNIIKIAHVMENLLGEVRNGNLAMTNDMVDYLLAANDCLKEMIVDVENSDDRDVSVHIENITAILENRKPNPSIEPVVEFVITDEKNQEVLFADNEKTIITDALKHGHGLYKIRLRLNENIKANPSPVMFFNKLSSIGQIIDSYTDISEVGGLDDILNADINFIFLFTTVLEKTLISLALDIPEEDIVELDIDTKKEDLAQILMKDLDFSNAVQKLEPLSVQRQIGESNTGTTKDIIAHSVAIEEMKSVNSPGSSMISSASPNVDDAGDMVKKAQAVAVDDTVRVHVSLLNDLLNLASEMVLGRNQLLRCLEDHRKEIAGLNSVLQNIDNITTELQEKIMQTRMQPVAKVFNKFPRIIRELSKKLGKDIDLQMEGTEVELDKSIIESLADPLTHLIRNAADHGIERPELRELQGKSKTGHVFLKAYHEGGRVNIDIIDDGAGIKVEKIKAKALERGLMRASEAESMSEREILNMLFQPGFSTAEQVTDVSGRGVGMDVVKTNIEKLGGAIDIMTRPGQGTTFRLALPLTLAIIPSLIVEVAGQKFALPQVNLQEMVRIKPGDPNRKIERCQGAQVLRLRGRLLPIIHLGNVLGLRKEPLDTTKVVRVLVLKIGTKQYGLAVDAIHDGEEILVKPLPKHLGECPCYSGVTILGDGKVAMILNPEGISGKANLRFTEEQPKKSAEEEQSAMESMAESQNLLLFQCSGTETFSLDLSMVARVEPIQASQIERIGEKEYIQFRGDSLRVIRPEQYLPVTRREGQPDKLYVIIPKLVKYPMGILIHRIDDIIQTRVKFNQENIKAKGLVGSTILHNRIVLVINIYDLFELAAPDQYQVHERHSHSGNRRTVLLVEDTPFFAKMERSYLEWAGYRVLYGSNGKEAWEILQNSSVDVVVSDIQMPIMDGYELVKRIRADQGFASLPVIALTSMTDERSRQLGREAGFDFYEAKLDKERILDRLEEALRLRREAG
ncbi:response regulator [Heliobacillus mobilis]|uniref:Stage 0 sporulation protein A homolog n=1 Tax=Heliobacterium mobile TaxID=28064 RepID=A0A6I3SJD4_HELMO|nr:chemotaxis protein CheW [Heliobacterium mobile]MTV48885.1 response regulator [Heliobacterium mobile]